MNHLGMCIGTVGVVVLIAITQCALGKQDELKIEVLHTPEECTRKTKNSDHLEIHYTGTLEDGTKFDSSLDRGKPFQFQLGNGEVIQGWDQGLQDMCIGEKRKLTIPSHLAYGEKGAGNKIPPGATLTFEVELMDIRDSPKSQNIFKEIDADGDNQLSQDEVSIFIRKQEKEYQAEATEDEKHNEMIADIFKEEDSDKDGFISFDEFSGPKHDEL